MSTLKEICKEQTELLNECRQNIKELTEENERLERENEQKTKVISLYKKAYEKTHKGWFRYRELTNHIRAMKFASPYSYNYIHLVNFIKELERADDATKTPKK
ncbi:hypothetical protein [Staphylococcus nepalensis]|uniref:hypothetical protein n=1 Tax=Staphylococcus nepalensis TaxID=214473 RepID=UPI00301797C9